jgi:hypothetical protein
MKILTTSIFSLIFFSISIIAQTNNSESEIKKTENLVNTKNVELKKDSSNAELKSQIDSLKSEIKALQNQINLKGENEKPKIVFFTLDKILSIFALLTSLVFGVLFILNKMKRRDEILFVLTQKKQNETTISRLDLFKNEIIDKAVEKSQSKGDSNNSTNLDIFKELWDKISKLEEGKSKIQPTKTNEKNYISEPIIKITTLFADAILNGVLNKVTEYPNDDTIYELILEKNSERKAMLTIYSDAHRRILKNTDFIEGCTKQLANSTPTKIEIENGEVQKNDSGKWIVNKKVNVKLV